MATAVIAAEDEPLQETGRRRAISVSRAEHYAMFLLGFLPAIFVGIWLLYVAKLMPSDAVTRVAHAHHVVLSRDPHIASIGFIWPPLPSAIEIPFVLLLQPFGEAVFAGPIFSALFTGGLVVVVNQLFAELRITRGLRLAAIGAMFVNPLMFYYAGNGMTEIPFIFCVAVVAWCFARWRRDELSTLISASLATAAALAIRYEAAAVLLAGVAGIVAIEWAAHPRRLEATLTTYVVPFAFALMLWSFWSHLFIGDALNFLRGIGSNESFTEAFRGAAPEAGPMEAAFHSVSNTLTFSSERLVKVFPPFIPVTLISLYFAIRGRDSRLFAVVLISVSVPAFQVLQVYRGQLFPWVRFWMTIIPFTFVMVAMWRNHLPITRFRPVFIASLLIGVVSSVSTLGVMASDVTSPDEALVSEPIVRNEVGRMFSPLDTTVQSFRDAATYLDGLEREAGRPIVVLVDAFAHAELVLYVDRPRMLAITPDQDFRSLLVNLVGNVDYVLIPAPIGVAAISDINATYPGAWESGTPFLEFVTEFTGIAQARLYRVVERQAPLTSAGR